MKINTAYGLLIIFLLTGPLGAYFYSEFYYVNFGLSVFLAFLSGFSFIGLIMAFAYIAEEY